MYIQQGKRTKDPEMIQRVEVTTGLGLGGVTVGHLFRHVTNQLPKANSAFHPSGVFKRVAASAVLLGRQRHVWFIPLADERGVCR